MNSFKNTANTVSDVMLSNTSLFRSYFPYDEDFLLSKKRFVDTVRISLLYSFRTTESLDVNFMIELLCVIDTYNVRTVAFANDKVLFDEKASIVSNSWKRNVSKATSVLMNEIDVLIEKNHDDVQFDLE